ncbi:hypothetical protein AGOR_G00182570 [Albula goreensis]|uniref:AIG1-type G domain-containing protein n=1 Tax=Albula goreensis TaxID=1534307 RepID=A0A8T3CWT5_9TELE|nr:hypothetical protein AGOR_G00182570 [Albula goreensis]
MATSQIREEALQLTEMRLVLLGKRGAGKTAAGNTIFGREEFRREGESCVKRRAEVAGRQVIVVDTPGWDRVNVQRTSDQTKEELKRSVLLCPPGPHALLLVIPLEEFPERENKAVNKHMHFLGERAWRHTIVLLTSDDGLRGITVEEHIAKEKHLQRLVEKCGNRYHFLSNVSGCPRTQVTELLGKIEEMVAENGGEFYIPQVYYDIIESRTPKEYTDLRREHEEKVWLLKERWRKREEELKKENEELKKHNKELYKGESESRGLRKRRSSLENPPNLAGERTEEEERQQKEEKEGTGQMIDQTPSG